jgi:hypothetical protein
MNTNKKSINKLNDIVINQRKEIEELKNEIEDLKKSNIVYEKENLKQINEKINSYKIENLEFMDLRRNEITKEIKEEIKNIKENEIEYIYNNIASLNIEAKENIEKYNKLKNTIEIDIKKETEELKNKVEYLIYFNQKEKKELEAYQNDNEEDICSIDKRVQIIETYIKNKNLISEEENNKINNEIIVLKETIQNIKKKEIEYIYDKIANLNVEIKENIKLNIKTYDKLKNIIEIDIKTEIEKIKMKEIETNERNKILEEENIKINNEIIVLKEKIQNKETTPNIHENEIKYINKNISYLNIEFKENNKNISNLNIEVKENIEKYNKLRNKILKENIEKNNEIIILKQIIQNIQENEMKYIYENISNLNIEVKENKELNNNTNNEIIQLKEIKNNLQFSYIISSYNYHISYLKDIVKLEIDLFTKLINNNILPINFITPQGNDNDLGQYWHVTKHFMNKHDNKEKLKKYFNVNDIMNNKYSFDLTSYICFNNTKFIDFSGRFIHNYYRKNTHNKYAIPFIYGGTSYKGSEIKIQHNIISKNNFYKCLYNEKNELIIENNDFIKMIENKEDIDEMEEMILDCLERYEFMKTLKTNTIYLS